MKGMKQVAEYPRCAVSVLLVLHRHGGMLRFGQVVRAVRMSDRSAERGLAWLTGKGLTAKNAGQVNGKKFAEYALTPRGRSLVDVILPLMEWQKRYGGA